MAAVRLPAPGAACPRAPLARLADGALDDVVEQLAAEGPLTATELGGAKNGGPWWDWSETKIAVEWLLDTGEVVCTERRGWKRVYDLAERAVPDALLHDDLDDGECMRRLVAQAGAALGVATRADLADYHRLKGEQVDAVLAGHGPGAGDGRGLGQPAWADPAALATRAARPAPHDAALARSTRWSGTGRAPSGSSASRTGWRRTCPGRSGSTATSRCRCWPAGG